MKSQAAILERVLEKLNTGENAEISKAIAERVIKAVDEARNEDILETGSTKFPYFGTVDIRYRKAKTGRNPKTNETLEIPESLTIGIKAGKAMKESLQGLDMAAYRK